MGKEEPVNVAKKLAARLDQGASLLGVALSELAQTQDPSINHLVGHEFEIFKANLLDAAKKILAARAMLDAPVKAEGPHAE